MEKIDEDIKELETRSVRDDKPHIEQECLFVLPEGLSHDSHASHGCLAASHFVKTHLLSLPSPQLLSILISFPFSGCSIVLSFLSCS